VRDAIDQRGVQRSRLRSRAHLLKTRRSQIDFLA
jgi:hypothetical protein